MDQRLGPFVTATRIRVVRIVVGSVLVLAALCLAGYFWVFTTTSEAIVSGRVVTLAAPITGFVEQFDLDVGDLVQPGQSLARLHNDRVDSGRLEMLRGQRASLNSRLAAVRAEMLNKVDESRRFRADFQQQLAFEKDDLERQIQEAQACLKALEASRARKESDFRAATSLLDRQLISRAEQARALEEMVTSTRSVEGQSSVVARLAGRLRAVHAGLFIGTQTPAQKSRIEDAAVRLAELDVAANELAANVSILDRELRAEERQVQHLAEAIVVSPVRGYVWKRSANAGQHVPAGAVLAEIVDASSIQIEAYFHQSVLPDVRVGDRALVSPVGSRSQIQGTVRWIGADASGQAPAVAPQWSPRQDTPMRVLLSIGDRDRSLVWVGQRVRVAVVPPLSAGWSPRRLYLALSGFLAGR